MVSSGEHALEKAIDKHFGINVIGNADGKETKMTNLPDLLRNLDLEDMKNKVTSIAAILGDPKEAEKAVGLLRIAGQDAIETLKVSRPDAKEYWYGLSWQEQLEFLRQIANPSDPKDPAANAVYLMEGAGELPKILKFLKDALEKIVRPAENINGYRDLALFLENLEKERLVLAGGPPVNLDKPDNPNNKAPIGIMKTGGVPVFYRPNRNVPIVPAAWPALLDAEKRATAIHKMAAEKRKQIIARGDELRKLATPGLTLLDIVRKSKAGDCYLPLLHEHGALLRFTQQPDTLRVEIPQATSGFTWKSIVVSRDGEFRALRGRWPSEEYSGLLRKKLQEEEDLARAEAEIKEKREKTLSPVTSLATLPIPLEGQGLTRLLNGEVGVAAMHHWDFAWDGVRGFLALAVERREGEKGLYLKAAVTYHRFPFEELQDKPLPDLVLHEDGRVDYAERFSGLEPKIFKALMIIRASLQLRLNAEASVASGKKPATEGNHNHLG